MLGGGVGDHSTTKNDFVVGNAKFFSLTNERDFLHYGELFFGDLLDGGIIRKKADPVTRFGVTDRINGFRSFHQCHAGSRVRKAEGPFEGNLLIGNQDSIQLFFGFIVDQKVVIGVQRYFEELFGELLGIFRGVPIERDFLFASVVSRWIRKDRTNRNEWELYEIRLSCQDDFLLCSWMVAFRVEDVFFVFQTHTGGSTVGKLSVTLE